MDFAEADMIDFMQAGDQYVGDYPHTPPDEVRDLRWKLIDEECNKELLPALMDGDLVGIADGCIDLIYVALGTLVAYGMPASALWDEVHASNMAKYKNGINKNEYGKIIKPDDWMPPNVKAILDAAGMEDG